MRAPTMVFQGRQIVRTASHRVLALALAVTFACDKDQAPELPSAEVFEPPVVVDGQWRGEVAGVQGILRVEDLAGVHFRGMFEASTLHRRYVLNLQQIEAPGPAGAPMPTNLLRFTWQDGRGDRGEGWLLVNREGSALTGSFGRGDGTTSGAGEWTFVRAATSAATPSSNEPEPDESEPDESATSR